MSEGKPLEGFGRGGRGAILLAALQTQPRRPGQTSPTNEPGTSDEPSQEPPAEPKPLGRGAFLQSLLSQGRGRALPTTPAVEPPRPVEPTRLVEPTRASAIGRGRGLALSSILSESSSKTLAPVSPTDTASSGSTASSTCGDIVPPTAELEELSISKYRGTSGAPLPLEVNYVRIRTQQGRGVYEYHVSFVPQVDSRNMKFRLIKDPAVKEVIGNVRTFDGSVMYLPVRLNTSPVSVTAHMPTDNSAVTVTIKLVKVCKPVDCLHLYNLLFRKIMHVLKMTQVGRNYFDPKGGIPVPQHRLEIWPGYVTAVQEYEDGVMLNCDASFRVLRTVTARDIMQDASKIRGNMKEEVTKLLVGCVVLTRYNNKTYKVDDIAWDMNPSSNFVTHSGSEISFMEYYKKSYDIQIKDPRQPLLINKAKKRDAMEGDAPKLICLIPELCFMTGLTDAMRNDFKVMKDVAVYTRVQPENRQLALQKFIDNVRNTPEARACLVDWNFELDVAPLGLDARLLQSEVLYFGRGAKVTVGPEADWGRQATSTSVLVPVHFEKWAVVFPKRDAPKVREFTKMLHMVCPKMGINVKEPISVQIDNDRIEVYCEALKDVINPTLQIVVVIFPTSRDDRYSAIKKLCCLERPIPSQAINLKTISDTRKLRSVVQKIALQMNCKLGGELWSVQIPLTDLMVCGLDTYHDNTRGRRSVLAFVASINQNRTRWFSMTTMQKQGQEVGDSLKMLFISSLRKYFEVNHGLPKKIILYRDGVGDGQIDFVAKYEVEQLTSCFKHFSPDYNPTLTVVVVQKRINTRMYAVEHSNNRKMLKNPPPGSVLDHTVTRKTWRDFFLVSQHVRQGTVSPTHYVIVYDSSTISPEHMQRITYKMTHLYYNWPGTVRVPAPCQYAHKLAYLVGQSLHSDTHADLADRLFYL